MKADFDREKQEWYIESPIALSGLQKLRVVNYLKQMYAKRIQGEIGDRRKRMQEAVNKLSVSSLKVRLVGAGEKTLYIDPGIKSVKQL
jgi:hypothetical protein